MPLCPDAEAVERGNWLRGHPLHGLELAVSSSLSEVPLSALEISLSLKFVSEKMA